MSHSIKNTIFIKVISITYGILSWLLSAEDR